MTSPYTVVEFEDGPQEPDAFTPQRPSARGTANRGALDSKSETTNSTQPGTSHRILTLPNIIVALVAVSLTIGMLSVFLTMLFSGRTSIGDLSKSVRTEVFGRVNQFLSDYLNSGPAGTQLLHSLNEVGTLVVDNGDVSARTALLEKMSVITESLIGLNIAVGSIISLNPGRLRMTATDTMVYADELIDDGIHVHSRNSDGTLGPETQVLPLPWQRFEQQFSIPSEGYTKDEFYQEQVTATLSGNAPVITSTYGRLIRDKATNEVTGLATVVVTMSAITDALASIQVGEHGFVYVTDQNGSMLASSTRATNARVDFQTRSVVPLRVEEVPGDDQAVLRESYARRADFKQGGKKYLYEGSPVTARPDWTIHVVALEDDYFGNIKKTEKISIGVVVGIIVVTVVLAVLISRAIVQPLRRVTVSLNRAARFDLKDSHRGDSSMIAEIFDIQQSLHRMQRGLHSFSRYVPVELVRQMLGTGQSAELGVERKELCFFFLDIRDFTTIAENTEQTTLVNLLSDFFGRMIDIIHHHQGTVDKLIGDAIMVFWGAPLALDDPVGLACQAALECQRALHELRVECRAKKLPELHARIGIHVGEASVGNVGSKDRLNYTALGDAVNLASRIEGLNNLFGTDIAVSDECRERVGSDYLFRVCDTVKVKGRSGSTTIFELVSTKKEASTVQSSLADSTQEIHDTFMDGNVQLASNMVDKALALSTAQDSVLLHLQSRIRSALEDPSVGTVLDLSVKTF